MDPEAQTERRRPIHTSVLLGVDTPMTMTILTKGPNYDLLTLSDPHAASPAVAGAPVGLTVRSVGDGAAAAGFAAFCGEQHDPGTAGVYSDGVWSGPLRPDYPRAADDAAGHVVHPGSAAVHLVLGDGVSIGPVVPAS